MVKLSKGEFVSQCLSRQRGEWALHKLEGLAGYVHVWCDG